MSLLQLTQLELHDAEGHSLHIDYATRQLAVVASQYVEEAQGYRSVKVTFQQLRYLETSPWLLHKATDEVEWFTGCAARWRSLRRRISVADTSRPPSSRAFTGARG